MKIVVVGAGVVGLCSALNIQETLPHAEVTIIADRFGEDTTSDGAAGIFRPVADHIPGVPPDKIREWSKDSWEYYSDLVKSSEANHAGVSVVSGYHVFFKGEEKNQIFKDIIYNYRSCSERELDQFNGIESARHSYAFTTLIIECRWFLPWMTKRIQDRGGKFVKRRLISLNELQGKCDAVINCTGLGSRELTGINDVTPVRGQVLRVKAPWIKHAFWTDKGCFVFPCKENVVIGGTKETGIESIEANVEGRNALWKEACQYIPSLQGAEFVRDWVGLRPLRSPIRVEKDEAHTYGGLPVFHNYGHGSYGVALGWGTGKNIASLLEEFFDRSHQKMNSKL